MCDFSTDKNILHDFVNRRTPNASTRTDLALDTAVKMMTKKRRTAKATIILLSDGYPDDTTKALASAEKAKKNNEITIFTVALLNANANPNASDTNKVMMKMAASSAHHFYVLGSQGLQPVYEQIVTMIGIANARKVVVSQTLSSQFSIVEGSVDTTIPKPVIAGNKITWSMSELREETIHLKYSFKAKDAVKSGTYPYIFNGSITYKNADGISQIIKFEKMPIKVKHSPVVIEKINEKLKGEEACFGIEGGEQVVIKGSNFSEDAIVKLGNTRIATSKRKVMNHSTIEFLMPKHKQGTDEITVTNPNGEMDSCIVYFKKEPVISKITPASGPYNGGNQVKINCQYVMQGATVTFDGKPAVVSSVKGNYILVKVPALQKAGSVDIKIINPDDTFVECKNAYSYASEPVLPTPIVTNINKTSGLTTSQVQLKISGKNFLKGMVSDVRLESTTDASAVDCIITSKKETYILCNIPKGIDAREYKVVLVYGTGSRYVYEEKTYTALDKKLGPTPIVTNINKTSGLNTTKVTIKITGKEFRNGAGFSVTLIPKDGGGNTITCGLSSVKSTYILCYVPPGSTAGKYYIRVTNNDGTSCVYKNQEYVCLEKVADPAPVITNINKIEGSTNSRVQIKISGKEFRNGVGFGVTLVSVSGNGSEIKCEVSSVKPTYVLAYVPPGSTVGQYYIKVTNSDGTNSIYRDKTYTVKE
jgi:molybdopterin-binding protein